MEIEGVLDVRKWPYRMPVSRIKALLVVEGEPLAKQRPRFTRKVASKPQAYYDSRHTAYEEYLGWQLKSAFGMGLLPIADELFGLRAVFYCTDKRKKDVDNMLKMVADAATGVVWKDDSQMREIAARVFTDQAQPRCEILIFTVPSPVLLVCSQCGKSIKRKPPSLRSKGPKYFCSSACLYASMRQDMICRICNRHYTIPKSLSKRRTIGFCSRECTVAWYHRPKNPNLRPQLCVDCGAKVTRREYTRCFPCAMKFRIANGKSSSKTLYDFIQVEPELDRANHRSGVTVSALIG